MNDEFLSSNSRVVFNIQLFRYLGFINILGPMNSKVFTVLKTLSVWVSLTMAYTLCGIIYHIKNGNIDEDKLKYQVLLIYNNYFLVILKLYTLCFNKDRILEILRVTRIDFLKSSQCNSKKTQLEELRNKINQNNYLYIFMFSVVAIVWTIIPISYYTVTPNKTFNNSSRSSVFNFFYPFTQQTFNKYYYLIYINEVIAGYWVIWCTLMFDLFLITSCSAIANQYEVVTSAFETLGSNENKQNNTAQLYENLISIILDNQNVHLCMEKLCSLIRLSVLTQTTGAALSTLIMVTYLILLHLSSGSYEIIAVLKYFVMLGALGTQIGIFTYYLDRMNKKKDNVNFGLYSCEWTVMDIGFKKSLLLAMSIHNSNRLAIKATPTVLRVSYTIVSVMMNTRHASSD